MARILRYRWPFKTYQRAEEPDVSDDEDFLSRLPGDGQAKGNISLRDELEWSEARYLAVRERLLQEDLISLGKGRGGSVRLVEGDMRALSRVLLLEGGRATHKKLAGKLDWDEARYVVAIRRLWKEKVVETGPRGTLLYSETPEAEEWLLRLLVPNAATQAFDKGKVASILGWTEQRVWAVRARCIENAKRLEAERPSAKKSARGTRARKPEVAGRESAAKSAGPANSANHARLTKKKLSAFVAYARVDNKLRERLDVHLAALRRGGKIDAWCDQEILPGEQWSKAIRERLDSSELILLLVSADFLHSDYCYGIEMKRALERHAEQRAWVVPIILRPCDWKSTPLLMLQALPANGEAITAWSNEDAAFLDVVGGIRSVVAKLGLDAE